MRFNQNLSLVDCINPEDLMLYCKFYFCLQPSTIYNWLFCNNIHMPHVDQRPVRNPTQNSDCLQQFCSFYLSFDFDYLIFDFIEISKYNTERMLLKAKYLFITSFSHPSQHMFHLHQLLIISQYQHRAPVKLYSTILVKPVI